MTYPRDVCFWAQSEFSSDSCERVPRRRQRLVCVLFDHCVHFKTRRHGKIGVASSPKSTAVFFWPVAYC